MVNGGLSTSEKLVSLNPAVRREGQRELAAQQPSSEFFGTSSAEFGQVSPTGQVEKTPEQISRQFFPREKEEISIVPKIEDQPMIRVSPEAIEPMAVQKIGTIERADAIPQRLRATSSLEFGQVSPTGQVEFTPQEIAAGRGGAIRREPKPLFTQFEPLTSKEKLRKAELEGLGEFRTIGLAGFKGFKSIVVSTAEEIVVSGKALGKGVIKESLRTSPFVQLGLRQLTKEQKQQLPEQFKFLTEKPVTQKVAEQIVPTTEFIIKNPLESLAITVGVAGAVGRQVLKKPVSTVLEFGFFSGVGGLPKLKTAAQAAKETAILRTRFSLRAGKVQLGEIKPTPTPKFQFKQVEGELVFGEAGEILGRQTKLREQDIVKSIITSPQAEFKKPLLAEKKSAKELDQFLGKFLPRPLSPKEVETVRGFQFSELSEARALQTEIKPLPEFEVAGLGRIKIERELRPPEEVFPKQFELKRRKITDPSEFLKMKGVDIKILSETKAARYFQRTFNVPTAFAEKTAKEIYGGFIDPKAIKSLPTKLKRPIVVAIKGRDQPISKILKHEAIHFKLDPYKLPEFLEESYVRLRTKYPFTFEKVEEYVPKKTPLQKFQKIFPRGKKAQLISESVLREDPFAKFDTEFFTRISKPKEITIDQIGFPEIQRTRVGLGTSAALALAQRPKQLPKQILKQVQFALPVFEQLIMPGVETSIDIDILLKQKQLIETTPRQIVIPRLNLETFLGGAPLRTGFDFPKPDIPTIPGIEKFIFPFLAQPPRLKQVKRKKPKKFTRMFQPSPTLVGIEQKIFGKGFEFATGFETIRPIPLR